MELIYKFIISVLSIGIGLAASRKLVSATPEVAFAALASQNQMVSLSSWSQRLVAPRHHKHTIK